jgi:hnRNP-L/PTB/hephaestus splicing factor
MYPVSIEMLHTVFARYGVVEKIVTFQKDQSVFQAMVQLGQPSEAAQALQVLDSQNLFTGCNTLKIQYSTFGELTVKYNNAKTRDFINHDLPTGPDSTGYNQGGMGMNGDIEGFGAPLGFSGIPTPAFPGGMNGRGDYGFEQQSMDPQSMYGQMGMNNQMGWHGNAQAQQAQQVAQGTVVICYHLTPDRLSVDQLFNIFSFYGLVSRIKIMQNKPDCCLVQYTEPLFAQLALQHLQGAQLYGQSLHLDFSKMREINIQPSNTDGRTKQYTPQEQRYQPNAHSRVMRNACKPMSVLHISNVSIDATERDLRAVFGPHGRIKQFRWIDQQQTGQPLQSHMALLEMEQTSEATVALVHAHNAPLRDRQLKVSFSKASIDSDGPLPE